MISALCPVSCLHSFRLPSPAPTPPVMVTLGPAAVPTMPSVQDWQWSVQLHDWHGNSPLTTWHCAQVAALYSVSLGNPHKQTQSVWSEWLVKIAFTFFFDFCASIVSAWTVLVSLTGCRSCVWLPVLVCVSVHRRPVGACFPFRTIESFFSEASKMHHSTPGGITFSRPLPFSRAGPISLSSSGAVRTSTRGHLGWYTNISADTLTHCYSLGEKLAFFFFCLQSVFLSDLNNSASLAHQGMVQLTPEVQHNTHKKKKKKKGRFKLLTKSFQLWRRPYASLKIPSSNVVCTPRPPSKNSESLSVYCDWRGWREGLFLSQGSP